MIIAMIGIALLFGGIGYSACSLGGKRITCADTRESFFDVKESTLGDAMLLAPKPNLAMIGHRINEKIFWVYGYEKTSDRLTEYRVYNWTINTRTGEVLEDIEREDTYREPGIVTTETNWNSYLAVNWENRSDRAWTQITDFYSKKTGKLDHSLRLYTGRRAVLQKGDQEITIEIDNPSACVAARLNSDTPTVLVNNLVINDEIYPLPYEVTVDCVVDAFLSTSQYPEFPRFVYDERLNQAELDLPWGKTLLIPLDTMTTESIRME